MEGNAAWAVERQQSLGDKHGSVVRMTQRRPGRDATSGQWRVAPRPPQTAGLSGRAGDSSDPFPPLPWEETTHSSASSALFEIFPHCVSSDGLRHYSLPFSETKASSPIHLSRPIPQASFNKK
ncbi:hypothetical protein HPP92_028998 [Vanilla planifolia]|uniref:Uncharacterized protein n=1 Tax=Vanilla planifolia TaxID=51239 RepID=A0A835P3W4_VANPL|nr:hypothetical protein HPP92_028998 [Vanilla planifolia]KAG0446121.1 hypothetical protein HPP92_028987 [Vanilla planifolia]